MPKSLSWLGEARLERLTGAGTILTASQAAEVLGPGNFVAPVGGSRGFLVVAVSLLFFSGFSTVCWLQVSRKEERKVGFPGVDPASCCGSPVLRWTPKSLDPSHKNNRTPNVWKPHR